MTTDVFPVVQDQPNAADLIPGGMSAWMLVFYSAMSIALILSVMRMVYPPDEARIDPASNSQVR